MFFTKEYHDHQLHRGADNALYKRTLSTIRTGYASLLEGPHKSYNINKVCRVLSAMGGPEEGALLKEIVTAATAKLETMDFNEFVHLINMVFPYIHREQILMWNRAKFQMQNANPFFSQGFAEELIETRETSVFHRVCEKVKERLSNGQMKKDEFF